ncbi:PIN domain-containing protein [Natronoglycomyces albus]|uniref:Ribonuclease VapC n=1 Tax=Natronoglycomyces albus TaxID=2811108 RepID=A0A895XJS9_9ACTN|nr:PIN domain-containing protein [Natronoglycomyces albus]QSB05267.1 PIN domain-containing protein [Natronoglycomyces albus]
MGRRVILDTGVLVAAVRGRISLDSVCFDDDDIAIAAVTVAELLAGVELANDYNRGMRQRFIDTVLALVPAEDYNMTVARVHARLLAYVKSQGKKRGAYDLMIAATAVATARSVVTTDESACFDELPGVSAIVARP